MNLRFFAVLSLLAATFAHAQSARQWTLYTPQELPPGRVTAFEEAARLTGDLTQDRTYVTGDFLVTASGQNRAVLRSDPIDPQSRIRLIVEFPDGYSLPAQQTHLSRDASHPYLVTAVRITSDGYTNIYARECMKEP